MKLDRESRNILIACAILAIICMLVLTNEAKASEPPQHVVTYTSEAGESLDQFTTRIAPDALDRSLSPAVSGEVCGEFHVTSDGYAIDVYTTGKLETCDYMRNRGREYTGLTFHTHISIGEANRAKRHLARFSAEDYDHPGYMASDRVLLFHNGRGTDRRVASQ